MADEPILCFDGDAAGRRAAYRAVDIALPLLKPGKSLKFAMLPEGHDPDDLVRTGGRDAVADLIGAARPLADVLWMRETETGAFDTPERRAALEARVGEVTAAIGDETVRRYYRQDFRQRLRNLLEPARPALRRYAGGPSAMDAAQHWRARSRQIPAAAGVAGARRRPALTWSQARSLRPARCIAATAPPSPAASP